MGFSPPFCPSDECLDRDPDHPFLWHRRGSYRRKCDGLVVPRFTCRTCGSRFSRQTFRFNYRWRRPTLHLELFKDFISKVTLRQAARNTGAARATVTSRMRAMGAHCQQWHQDQLVDSAARFRGTFVMDEMESFETDRRVRPITIPVLIQKGSLFVIHAESAPLPPRGRLDAFRQLRKLRDERLYGKRQSGSRAAVERTLLTLGPLLHPRASLNLITDRKSSYRKLVWTHFADRFGSHVQESSRTKRSPANPLFPINHTLAMLRDGVSRLVRRNWGAAKLRARLDEHIWIWIAYRNYVRGVTNKKARVTPAMVAGVADRQLVPADIFRWRWIRRLDGQRIRPAS